MLEVNTKASNANNHYLDFPLFHSFENDTFWGIPGIELWAQLSQTGVLPLSQIVGSQILI
jgi:hypothetical protein